MTHALSASLAHGLTGVPRGAEGRSAAMPHGLPESELAFYQDYSWCLNPFRTVRETAGHLRDEIGKLAEERESWQTAEIATNVWLLSCALLNAVDDYLRGKTFQLPKRSPAVPLFRALRWAAEKLLAVPRAWGCGRVHRWREDFGTHLDAFLALFPAGGLPDRAALAAAANGLAVLLRSPLPAGLQAEHIGFASAFRRLDLTPLDVLALGRRFAARFPDRQQPVLVVGLRTAGSYFAPLLRAFLAAEGYRSAAVLTVRPDKGPGAWERAELARRAREGYLAAVVDDPPLTGDTIVRGVDLVRKAGFAPDKVAVLVPVHPASRDWRDHSEALFPAGTTVLALEPEEWHKQQLLEAKAAEDRLAEYFQGRYAGASADDRFNAQLDGFCQEGRRTRLKRVYAVRLQNLGGGVETRYVLAKSVGWGWLGYHALLAGCRLAGLVPPVLGLRDGILYSEWFPQPLAVPFAPLPLGDGDEEDREEWVAAAASYVAARTRSLGLGKESLHGVGPQRHHNGYRLLEKALAGAYGGFVTATLMRPRIRQRLAGCPCPVPTLIDGKMQRWEWVAGPAGPLKTDYEHHGLGKSELNAIDPAYDLAEAVLHGELAPEEEGRLIRRYVAESGDAAVGQRLFLNKLLAGTAAMASALEGLFQQPPLAHQQQAFHRQFVAAWHFLTVHTARFCGGLCRPPEAPAWRSPLVVLDIDGVLDGRLFGFPSTTAAGIRALALLRAHGLGTAVNTARSVPEVREYCRAYGLAGGVAEYGSYVWDAAGRRGQALVGPESLRQLAAVRQALGQLPGVFLDDRHQYSIRAWTYEDKRAALDRLPLPGPLRSFLSLGAADRGPVPLPTLAVRQVLAALGADRLEVEQTTIDTTIRAREVDKGSGLSALLSWVGRPDLETVAVGDSEPDLAMYRVAGRSLAPSHVSGARRARLLGCRIVRQPCQRGLLEIARSLVHPGGGRCPCCASGEQPWPKGQDLFLDLLRVADRRRWVAFLRALFDPRSYRIFVR
jgi:hydroxymethylpyrimidine pyrophosphatase-like HAD family hydrolase